jgi:hypothetical protein
MLFKANSTVHVLCNYAAIGQVVANPDFSQTPDFSSWNISLAGWYGAATTGNVYSYSGQCTASICSALYSHIQQG